MLNFVSVRTIKGSSSSSSQQRIWYKFESYPYQKTLNHPRRWGRMGQNLNFQPVVSAHTHTSTRAQRCLRSAHTQLAQMPYPPAPPPPRPPFVTCDLSFQRSFGQLKIVNRPTPGHKLRPCFQVPTDSQGLWGPHEQYLSDPWAPGHAVLCVWKPE